MEKQKRKIWIGGMLFLAVSIFFYVSIMYKIIHFGP
jgi:hypothetical protein